MKKNKYSWLKCIRNYRFQSIFLKNLALIFSLILLPFICILGISTYAYDALQKSEEKAYTDVWLTRSTMDVENLLTEIRDKAILVENNLDVQMFFYSDSLEHDTYYETRDIVDFLSIYSISTEVIDSAYVYAPHINAVISKAGRYHYDDFSDKACIDSWQDNGERFQFGFVSRKVIGKKTDTVSFYYTVNYTLGRGGVVIINMNTKELDKKFDYGDGISLSIVQGDEVLYSGIDGLNGIALSDAAYLLKPAEHEIVIREELEESGLEIILHIDSSPLYAKLQGIRVYILLFVGIMLFITIFLVFYISQKIFDPIREILNILEADMVIQEEDILQKQNEVSIIRDSIYANISKRKSVEEELHDRIKLLKKAQAVALQAQINPHFIYNVLETINWKAVIRLGGENEISEITNWLSQILRFSLGDSDTFVTLREEIEYAEKYLLIQQERLNNNFDVIWQIPQELLECRVIKMILQPVIENAIKYGIKPYKTRGKLCITATETQELLVITIKDSGLGLTQAETEELNHSIRKQVIKESDHIGLTNVNQRIILAFGEAYGVTVESVVNQGTSVKLELPYQK